MKKSGSGWKTWLETLRIIQKQGTVSPAELEQLQMMSFSWSSQMLNWLSHAGLVQGIKRGTAAMQYHLTKKGEALLHAYVEHIVDKGKFLKLLEEVQELRRDYLGRSTK